MDATGARDAFVFQLPECDFDAVYSGKASLDDQQVTDLYTDSYEKARLAAGRQVRGFAQLADEAKAVVIDMIFNLGEYGFSQFKRLRDALALGNRSAAAKFMEQSLWYSQVKSRGAENVAIMRPAAERSAAEVQIAEKWGVTA